MNGFSVIVNIPKDGETSTVRLKTSTPFFKRITGVYAEYAGKSNLIAFDEFATVGIKVGGSEVIPDNFPLRWITPAFFTESGHGQAYPSLRRSSKWAELPMDEEANGRELEVVVTSSRSVVLFFSLDNREAGAVRKRYKIVPIQPTNGWQRPRTLPASAWGNNMITSAYVDIGGCFTGVLCEYVASNIVTSGMYRGVAPSIAPKAFADGLGSTSLEKRDILKSFLSQNTWITINTLSGVELVSSINASLISPNRNISFKHAELRKQDHAERVSVTAQFPFFFTGYDAGEGVNNALPFSSCHLAMCFTYSEKK